MHELLGFASIADCQFGTRSVLNEEKLALRYLLQPHTLMSDTYYFAIYFLNLSFSTRIEILIIVSSL